MAKVLLSFLNAGKHIVDQKEIATTGDSAYVFDDISNYIHEGGEFSNVPEGTKEIVVRIPCDM